MKNSRFFARISEEQKSIIFDHARSQKKPVAEVFREWILSLKDGQQGLESTLERKLDAILDILREKPEREDDPSFREKFTKLESALKEELKALPIISQEQKKEFLLKIQARMKE